MINNKSKWYQIYAEDEDAVGALIEYLNNYGSYEYKKMEKITGYHIRRESGFGLSEEQLLTRANSFISGFMYGRNFKR